MTTMDDCRRTADRLTSYVDDALPAGERADVERHLGACPPLSRGRAARARRTDRASRPGARADRDAAAARSSQPL